MISQPKIKSSHIPDRDLDTVDEFCRRGGGISRTTFYELLKEKRLSTVKIGSRTYIPRLERERFLASLSTEAA